MNSKIDQASLKYAFGILFLLLCFCVRVFAQLIQVIYPNDVLPPFDVWQSGALPYGLLLLSQVIIIAISGMMVKNFANKRVIPTRNKGKIYLFLGGVYFFVMGFRLIAGLTFAKDHFWLGAKIPAFFHLVLASVLLLIGKFHYTYNSEGHSLDSIQ